METKAQKGQGLALQGIFDGAGEKGNLWTHPLTLTMGHAWSGLSSVPFPLTFGSLSPSASGHMPTLCPLEMGASEGSCTRHPQCEAGAAQGKL